MTKISQSITTWLVPGALALGMAGCMTDDVDSDELGSTEQEVQAGKRTICHYDGQGRAREITISENAVPAHFANHDDHDRNTYYADGDGDGHGAGAAILACTQPPGTSTNADDCNDGDAGVNPGAAEVCDDGIDNDCSGGDGAADTYYGDGDGDGHGAGAPILVCEAPQPAGTSTTDDDCDDGNADVYPGNAEVCDGVDNNCDGAYAAASVFMFDSSGGQRFNGGPGCTTHVDQTARICRDSPTQTIRLSTTADGAGAMYYDELGVVEATPVGGADTNGANYRWWEPTCLIAGYPDVAVGTNPVQLNITWLFDDQVGEFDVRVRVRNAHQPYEWFTTWLVALP
jgi:hypothetical protein